MPMIMGFLTTHLNLLKIINNAKEHINENWDNWSNARRN